MLLISPKQIVEILIAVLTFVLAIIKILDKSKK